MPGRFLLKKLFGSLVWNIQTKDPLLFLTFDDGPIPEVTSWVLDKLEEYGAKATFFCVGDNVKKHPVIYQSLLDRGHAVGNHTFHHLNGWKTANEKYYSDIEECRMLVSSNLFRPPYGRLTPSQMRKLKRHYRLVMWDVLSKDYDQGISNKDCLANVIGHARHGSIVVFHDSLKAKARLEFALPRVLDFYSKMGYRFVALTNDYLSHRK